MQNEGSISTIRLSLKISHFSRNSLPTTFSTSWAVTPWSNRLAFSFAALCLTHATLGQATASRVPSDMANVQHSPRHSVQLLMLLAVCASGQLEHSQYTTTSRHFYASVAFTILPANRTRKCRLFEFILNLM